MDSIESTIKPLWVMNCSVLQPSEAESLENHESAESGALKTGAYRRTPRILCPSSICVATELDEQCDHSIGQQETNNASTTRRCFTALPI